MNIEVILATLTSDEAIRNYVRVDLALFGFVSVAHAFQILVRLRDFDRSEFVRRFPGQKPKKEDSIQRQAQWKREHASKILRAKLGDGLTSAILGIGAPLFLFCVFTIFSTYLVNATPALAYTQTGAPITNPNDLQIAFFVLDQFLKGALTDVFEVFSVSLSTVANNPSNVEFSGIVLIFRMLIDTFVVGLGVSALATIGAWHDAMELAKS